MSAEQIAENGALRRRAVADHLGNHFRNSHTRRADEAMPLQQASRTNAEAAPLQPASRANAEAVREREPPRSTPGEIDAYLRGIRP